jgi:hypothetical protein
MTAADAAVDAAADTLAEKVESSLPTERSKAEDGEEAIGGQGVVGSNPAIPPTNFFKVGQ